ncbi:MAG: DUF4294 domain-containing protein [Bacteroidota bacterium]|nr:DUF4294 domain-containing protein [Bacteroidota bacterium]
MKKFVFILLCMMALIASGVLAQDRSKSMAYKKVIDNKDTIWEIDFPYVDITAKRVFKNAEEAQKFSKLMRDVKKVYPYAKIAGYKIRVYNDDLAKLNSKKDRKEYLKKAEKELKAEYEPVIRNMTFTQGKILIKLIDRETDKTSYELIKELKGSFSAWLWQVVARVFGANLKMEYDLSGEDRMIEQIITQIEAGKI